MLGRDVAIVFGAGGGVGGNYASSGRASCAIIATTSRRRLSWFVIVSVTIVAEGVTIVLEVLVASDTHALFWWFLGYRLQMDL